MTKHKKDEYKCPLEATMDIIGGKYKGVIIGHLINKTLRYNELQKLISHATPKMLIQQLKELETDGIIKRKLYPVVPPKTEYSLTKRGETLIPAIIELNKWGMNYLKEEDQMPFINLMAEKNYFSKEGIEAAIDLAGICSKVTVFEFLEELKADQVLQEKAKSLPNVEILVNSQTTEVVGDKEKVTGIRTKDRTTGNERLFPLDGIFVQIGLAANSSAFKEIVATNRLGEIIIDAHCRTDIPGIYAAGDVSTVPYKQIIISMGEGAKAALSAFEDRIKGVLD